MGKVLYPFVAPPLRDPAPRLSVIQSFDYWLDAPGPLFQPTPPTTGQTAAASFQPGVVLRTQATTFFLAPTAGDLAIVPDFLTYDDPNRLTEFLETGATQSEPEPTSLLSFFLRPSPASVLEFDALLPSEHGQLIGFYFSSIPYQAIKTADKVTVSNEIGSGTQVLNAVADVATNPNSPFFHEVLLLDEGTAASSLELSLRWPHFGNGRFAVNVPAGLVLAAVETGHDIGFAVLTSRGFIDPGRFYDLCTSLLDDLVAIGTLIDINGSGGLIPVSSNYATLASYQELRTTTKYLKGTLFEQIANAEGAQAYRDIGSGQKQRFLGSLDAIGGFDGSSYTTLQNYSDPAGFKWFRDWDWQNPFQLEALVEFYLNFRTPGNGRVPLRPPDPKYRRVEFDTSEVVSRNIDEVNATLPSGDTNHNYVPPNAYPPEQFPFILVLVDPIEHIGGTLSRDYDTQSDRYQGMMFVIERFQTVTITGGSVSSTTGYPRVVAKFPWTSQSSQSWANSQDKSSIAGNLLYIAFSNAASGKPVINYAFQVGNSYITAIDSNVKPIDPQTSLTYMAPWDPSLPLPAYNYQNTLPGILDPIGYESTPAVSSTIDQDGKGGVFLHRGIYSKKNTNSGSQGCQVSPMPFYYEFRKLLITSLLDKFDPTSTDSQYDFFRTIQPLDAAGSENQYNADVQASTANPKQPNYAGWGSEASSRHNLRCLFFVIRPREPALP